MSESSRRSFPTSPLTCSKLHYVCFVRKEKAYVCCFQLNSVCSACTFFQLGTNSLIDFELVACSLSWVDAASGTFQEVLMWF